jgi:hypothetical protein
MTGKFLCAALNFAEWRISYWSTNRTPGWRGANK